MCSNFDYSTSRCRRVCLFRSISAVLLGLSIMTFAAPASQAFTADTATSGSHQPLILPFHIGKPANGKTTGSDMLPQAEAFSPKAQFDMMGWPWLKANNSAAQPSQQQINADLNAVIAGMSTSAQRLKTADAGARTQAVQKKIIRRLDQLIKIAEQSQGKSGGQQKKKSPEQQSMSTQQASGSNTSPMTPSQSAKNSYIPGGGVMNPGDLKSFTSNKRQWGNLPARERNMILNALRHQTLPQYQSLVRQYYESLAKLNQPK